MASKKSIAFKKPTVRSVKNPKAPKVKKATGKEKVQKTKSTRMVAKKVRDQFGKKAT
jgi:hypothetical protein